MPGQMPQPISTQLHREIDGAGIDPFLAFCALKTDFPSAFFFETAAFEGGAADYTVIGLEAFEVLRIRAGRAERVRQGVITELPGAPMEALGAVIESYSAQARPGIPFGGGGVFGCFGYDCVRHIEPRLNRTGYFSRLNDSDEIEAELLAVRRLLVFDRKRDRVFLISNSEVDLGRMETFVRAARSSAGADVSAITYSSEKFSTAKLRATQGFSKFRENVAKIKSHIRAGDIFQAVLAERFEREVSSSAIEIFATLRRVSPAPYRFFFDFGPRSFFGASPEALLKLENGVLQTHPIAGTRPRGMNEGADHRLARNLRRSAKEKAEHLMLVDLARNDLGRIAEPGSVRVDSFMRLKRFPGVMHLVSEVTARLKPRVSPLAALAACFPAGTLSGAPKIRAMEILSELETVPRGLYGGAVVALGFDGRLDSCIAIRSLEMQGRIAILRAGAGVVADSRAENEYAEVQHKLHMLQVAINQTEEARVDGEQVAGAVS